MVEKLLSSGVTPPGDRTTHETDRASAADDSACWVDGPLGSVAGSSTLLAGGF
jgi:hypothetical protein